MQIYKFVFMATVTLFAVVSTAGRKENQRPPAEVMEKILLPVLPKSTPGGATILSAKAEGDVLAVAVDLPLYDGSWTDGEMNKMLVSGFCQGAAAERFIGDGGKLRFDISTGGGTPVEGAVIDHC